MARKELKPGTALCAPEILQRGVGVSSVNGGPGENELEPEGTCSRRRCESPPAILWFLSHRWERNSPHRAKPSTAARRVVAPYGRHGLRRTGGHIGPPIQHFRHMTDKQDGGQPAKRPSAVRFSYCTCQRAFCRIGRAKIWATADSYVGESAALRICFKAFSAPWNRRPR